MKVDKEDCLKTIIDNITTMLDNNKDYGTSGIGEQFTGWCAEGEIFMEEGKEKEKQCVEYMNRIAPLIDNLTSELLTIWEEIEEKNEK